MRTYVKWIYMLLGGFLAVGLITGAGVMYLRGEAAGQLDPWQPGLGMMNDGDPPIGDYEQALADALGITLDELHLAFDAIWKAKIEDAVEAGRLTDEQAERILSHEGLGLRSRRGPIALGGDMSELLAAELDISLSTLEAAQEKAQDTLVSQAIANGMLSEEHAELLQAHHALAPYLQERMTEAFDQAVASALGDGVITQSQADLLLEVGGPGMRLSPAGPGLHGRSRVFPGGRFFGTDGG